MTRVDVPPTTRSLHLVFGLAALSIALPGCDVIVNEAQASPPAAQAQPAHSAVPGKPLPGEHVGPIDEECVPNQPGDCEQTKKKTKKKKLHSTKRECTPAEVPSHSDTCPIPSEDPCFIEEEPSVCLLYTCRDLDDGDIVEECIGEITVPYGCKATPASCKPHVPLP